MFFKKKAYQYYVHYKWNTGFGSTTYFTKREIDAELLSEIHSDLEKRYPDFGKILIANYMFLGRVHFDFSNAAEQGLHPTSETLPDLQGDSTSEHLATSQS